MQKLTLEIQNIKNIRRGKLTLPVEKGVYAITGVNGSGKSTIINCLGKLVVDFSIYSLNHIDRKEIPSFSFLYKEKKDIYALTEQVKYRKSKNGVVLRPKTFYKWLLDKETPDIHFNGLYEGSFFFGKRFKDSANIDELISQNKISTAHMHVVDSFIGEMVSFILHNDKNHYTNLLQLHLGYAKKLGFKNNPCFISYGKHLVSQYRMSSGECLLISLFDFINNVIRDKMKKEPETDETEIVENSMLFEEPTFLIIDEIEAALHPSSIKRLMEYFMQLAEEYNFMIIISSHSAEVIRQIKPKNLFNIESSSEGTMIVSNPCFPSYAIRDVYTHIGYDVVILTEDVLAQRFVDQTLTEMRLKDKRLINILPVGGWENVIKLYKDLVNNRYFGPSTMVFYILDGDVKDISEFKSKYRKDNTPKMFLPIPSVEKFLQKIPTDIKYSELRRKLDSYIFNTDTILDLFNEFYTGDEGKKVDDDKDGKNFYNHVIKYIGRRGLSEDRFIDQLSSFILECIDTTAFKDELKTKMTV